MASTLMFIDEPAVFEAGEAYELVFERRDTNGFIGFVSPMIQWPSPPPQAVCRWTMRIAVLEPFLHRKCHDFGDGRDCFLIHDRGCSTRTSHRCSIPNHALLANRW